MPNGALLQFEAMGQAADLLIEEHVNAASNTAVLAIILLELLYGKVVGKDKDGKDIYQPGSVAILEDLSNKVFLESLNMDPGAGGRTKALQTEYQIASMKSDKQQQEWQTMILNEHNKVGQTNDRRVDNFSFVESLKAAYKHACDVGVKSVK